MSAARFIFIRILLLFTILLNSGRLNAQWELIENIIFQPFDTSGYIPYLYEDALDYNLMIAASKGYPSEIERLIAKGADVNAEADGVTPLIFAVANNKQDAVATILSYGPEVDKLTSTYETPLLIAAKNSFFETAELLIRAGADIDFGDSHGATPLHYAAVYGYPDIADLLIYYDADISARTTDGSTPLHGSIWAGNTDITDLLLQHGANPDEKDIEGFTPFLLSSYFGDTVVMDMLFKKGIDINAKSNRGYNALALAIALEQKGAVEYLLRTGSKWSDPAIGTDPYSVAAKYGRKDIIPILRENNVPGKLRYEIDQVAISLSSRFSIHDYYTGISLSFKEPFLNLGFTAGCDTKFWYTRVLMKETENIYYQYMDKGSVAYAGLFKDFTLKEKPGISNILFSASLLAGYSFGNQLKGTAIVPGNKFTIIPAVAFKWNFVNLSFNAGVEYIGTEFYHTGPVWLRLGIGYNYFFDNVRPRIKPPRWY